jgi:hypothetical protein
VRRRMCWEEGAREEGGCGVRRVRCEEGVV